ncbi:MAG TPA: bifunctional DNA-formamidopyrimidine glycosylase/DNA-(apurinic or apyrimidinic site) lyase [Anaerolineaceae bacterium]|nr:bifunctional DNA-formamidopyrimidine glycosylase/DNA-(apurinic or apyrimidinic site) lyase [Anaerolineaceae bacterium]
MPELPEVETIVRALRDGGRGGKSVLGGVITGAELRWLRTLAEPTADEFLIRLIGQRIEMVDRRAKFINFHLSRDNLLIHLRMSGDLRVEPAQLPPAVHDRALLLLDNGLRIAFHDTRKFGRIWLTAEPQTILGRLGPEPLSPDFTPDRLNQCLSGHRRQIKPLLLDQTVIAGLGNIYTDEALHRAGLHPRRNSQSLSTAEVVALWAGIRAVLQEGIDRNGASIDWVYRGGDFQNSFRVHLRAGQPCLVCGTLVERAVIGQRSSYFCSNCQPIF